MEEKLALLLRQYPAIWNRKSNDFKNASKKENSFKKLAKLLNTSVEAVQSKYKSLREKYRKEKIKLEEATCSGSAQIDFEPWYLMETLSFFNDVMLKRRTISNIVAPQEGATECTQEEITIQFTNDTSVEEIASPESFTFETILTPSTSVFTQNHIVNTPNISSKRKRKQSSSPSVPMMSSKIADAATELSTAQPLKCRFHGIAMYVAETLALMPEESADACVVDIISLVNKYKNS